MDRVARFLPKLAGTSSGHSLLVPSASTGQLSSRSGGSGGSGGGRTPRSARSKKSDAVAAMLTKLREKEFDDGS